MIDMNDFVNWEELAQIFYEAGKELKEIHDKEKERNDKVDLYL